MFTLTQLLAPFRDCDICNCTRYLFNVAYGIGKAGCDRMAADCGHELRKSNVAMVSLWPGPVKTEYIQENLMGDPTNPMGKMFAKGETIEFAGKAIVHLAADPNMMAKTCKILNTADLANEYSFTENDGTSPIDFRSAYFSCLWAGSIFEI